jgi:hypothetical protein
MSTQTEKVFADGFLVKRNDSAPEFVLASISLKVDEAIGFIKANANNGWVNIDLKRGQSGKCYAELNTWKPKTQDDGNSTNQKSDLPF